MKDDAYIRRATFLLWVGHSLERIGDRATNIAERVIFMCTGEFVETPSSLDYNGRSPPPHNFSSQPPVITQS
jgi:phosphate uptake regulator